MYRAALRQAWVEIDRDAIRHNLKYIKEKVSDADIIAVVKADGYGHGAVESAKIFAEAGVKCFAVATISEAITLREAGITEDILVLSLTPQICADVVIAYNLIPLIGSMRAAEALSKAASEMGSVGTAKTINCVFAVDSGMGRIGYRIETPFSREHALEEYQRISALPGLEIVGILTHFSSADEEDRSYTEQQIAHFDDFAEMLSGKGFNPKKFASNSAATMVFPNAKYDAVRAGIILYGFSPSGYLQEACSSLKPAMSVKANIAYIKTVPAGSCVSYGRKFVCTRDTQIATISIGYADGYPRGLSGKVDVLIDGQRCPVIGNICMDQCMIDVTDLPHVDMCTEVVIMGRSGDDEITAEMLAEKLGTINYEIICGFGERLHKVYLGEPADRP